MQSQVQVSIITGANRGFGKAIVEAIIKEHHHEENSKHYLVLIGRSSECLENVKGQMEEKQYPNIKIITFSGIDFSKVENLKRLMEPVNNGLKELIDSDDFKQAQEKKLWLFNNHGTIGDITKYATEFEPVEVHDYVAANYTSFAYLCTLFSRWAKLCTFDEKIMVNTSSLCAIEPMVNSSLYCSIKAARDMHFRVIAQECKEDNIRTLNYAPGPMEGDMQKNLRTNLKDEKLKTMFKNLFDEGKLVKMDLSAGKLIKLLKENKFESGAHLDFYDI